MNWSSVRSILFVPATSEHVWHKAHQRGADALVVDLEDAIPQERKADARKLLGSAIATLAPHAKVLVRVNAAPSMWADDVAALPSTGVAAVMLPKVESADQVRALARALAERGLQHLPIVALIETPRGVLEVQSVASAHASVCALGFGAEDYALEMLVDPVPASLGWAAHTVANAARAYGLASFGLPGSVAETQDMDAFAALVSQGRAVGFSGTVCIHPRQVAVVNAGFGPDSAQLQWAQRVVEADAAAALAGVGAVLLDGRMIDRPIVERARTWVRMHAQHLAT